MSSPRKRQADDNDDENLPQSSQQSSIARSSPHLPPSSPANIGFNEEEDDEINQFNDLDDLEERIDDEEDAIDLFGDDMEADYRENSRQDTYDLENIDDETIDNNDIGDINRVNAMLDRRDEMLRQGKKFLDDEDNQNDLIPRTRRRRNKYDDETITNIYDDDGDINPLEEELSLESLADVKASSITEWIIQPNVARTIARELKSFLLEYTDDQGRSVYGARIRTLGEVNSESLEVNYRHLSDSKAILAMFLATSPEEMLKIFDVVAMEATQLHYPNYSKIHSEIHVRISDFPSISSLRDLREQNLNSLIRVSGVVTRRTSVFPQLKYVKFNCLRCQAILGPYFQDANTEVKISQCPNCKSKGPFEMNTEKTLYRNYQRITLQESPGTVPAGRLPRHREVILLWDLVDIAKPGEEVEVTGVYKNNFDGNLNVNNGFPIFATVIEANSIKRREGGSKNSTMSDNDMDNGLDVFSWTEEEEREFRKLSRERGIIDKIINSIAPSIYGHKDIKSSVACSLFGGVPKNINGKHSIRGDINVLLIGDPGTAKSQILKYVEKTAHRSVFATGQGASAVGLTASVRKDTLTKEWTLEGGALVLADKGTCLIDEFDKMNDQDRTSIHEAMEQQSISISKAGIVTSLQARCSIIAAANPLGGRYNSTIPLSQNVDLTEPILSRFDLICVVRDIPNPDNDAFLAKFVIDSHMRSLRGIGDENGDEDDSKDHEGDEDLEDAADSGVTSRQKKQEQLRAMKRAKESEISEIPQELLIKYIHYARSKVTPRLSQMDMDKTARVYADLRNESLKTGAFPITVRHLESIIRIAEAFAKMRLSEFVSDYDLKRAIKISIDSFIGVQKVSVRKQLQRSFAKYTYGDNF